MENNNKEKDFYLIRLTGTVTEEVDQIVGIAVNKETTQENAVNNLLKSISEQRPNSVIVVNDVKKISEEEMQQFVEGLLEIPEEPRVLN